MDHVPLRYGAAMLQHASNLNAKKSRSRPLIQGVLAAGIVASLVTIAPLSASAAGTESPGSACAVEATDLVTDSVAEQTGDPSDGADAAFDFGCVGDTVTAQLIEDAGSVDAGTTFTTEDADANDTTSQATAAAAHGPAGLALFGAAQFPRLVNAFVGPGSSPDRKILDNYTDQVLTTVYYGQKNSPSNGTWTNDIDISFKLNLQKSVHLYTLKWNQLQFRNVGFRGNVSLERNNGVFSPSEVDFDTWDGKSRSSQTVNSNLYRDGLTSGIYAVRVWKMHVSDGARSFSLDVGGDFHTHRFSCPASKQCLFPGGKEAPVLG